MIIFIFAKRTFLVPFRPGKEAFQDKSVSMKPTKKFRIVKQKLTRETFPFQVVEQQNSTPGVFGNGNISAKRSELPVRRNYARA